MTEVCVVGTALNPVPTEAAWSGIESLCTYMVKGLVELGADVTLVSVEGSLWKDWDRINLIEVPVSSDDPEKCFYEGYKNRIKDYPCVIDNSNGKQARFANKRTINVSHWLQHPVSMGFRNVVCISKAHAKWTRAQYPFRDRGPVVVMNGIDPGLFPYTADKGDEYLFFSVLGPYKGADTVLKLALEHPEYRFGFGGRNTEYTQVIQEAAEKHENITCYGEVSHDEKKRIMGRARALLQLPKRFNPYEMYPFMDILPMTCLTPDTLVAVKSGWGISLVPISKIKIGDKVLTHKCRHKKVTAIYHREYDGDLIEVYPYGAPPTKITPNHPILIYKRGGKIDKTLKTQPIWVPANEVKKGDIVVFPIPKDDSVVSRNIDLYSFCVGKNISVEIKIKDGIEYLYTIYGRKDFEHGIPRFIEIDDYLGTIIGAYVSEGYKKGERGNVFYIATNIKEKEWRHEIKQAFMKKFDFVLKEEILEDRNAVILYGCSIVLSELFSSLCGVKAPNKHFPWMDGPSTFIDSMLKSYIMGDGSKKTKSITTTSNDLAIQNRIILLRRGLKPMMNHYEQHGFGTNPIWNMYYRCKETVHSNKSWITEIGQALLVRSVKKIEYKGPVHNLEVEEDNSYVAGFIAVHNCIEANLCGTPVIGLDEGGVKEMIEDGVNGYLCRSLDEVVEAMGKIHQVDTLGCRRFAEERFSYLRMAREYLTLVDRVKAGDWW